MLLLTAYVPHARMQLELGLLQVKSEKREEVENDEQHDDKDDEQRKDQREKRMRRMMVRQMKMDDSKRQR